MLVVRSCTGLKRLESQENKKAKYETKIRDSVVAIFGLFGNTDYCRICGCGWWSHDSREHEFTPRIRLSVDFEDPIAFYEDDVCEYRLAVERGGLLIVGKDKEYNMVFYPRLERMRIEVLKDLVKSGRIVDFLTAYLSKLDSATKEYKEVAAIATKIAKVVKKCGGKEGSKS